MSEDNPYYQDRYLEGFSDYETDGFIYWTHPKAGIFIWNLSVGEFITFGISFLLVVLGYMFGGFWTAMVMMSLGIGAAGGQSFLRKHYGASPFSRLFWKYVTSQVGMLPPDGFCPFDYPTRGLKKVQLNYEKSDTFDPDHVLL